MTVTEQATHVEECVAARARVQWSRDALRRAERNNKAALRRRSSPAHLTSTARTVRAALADLGRVEEWASNVCEASCPR